MEYELVEFNGIVLGFNVFSYRDLMEFYWDLYKGI